MNGSVRVVKVGGSLLGVNDLPLRLHAWLGDQPPAKNVVIAGAGPLADVIRELDARFDLGDAASHDLAIRAMSVTAGLFQRLLPRAAFAATWRELNTAVDAGADTLVFDVADFLGCEEQSHPGTTLTQSWDVTSDSIGARIATVLSACELVLLKSADVPENTTREAASKAGFVDAAFPEYVDSVDRVRWVNLRAESVREGPLIR